MEIDKVYFTVDSDGADTLLHENFKQHVDYKELPNGDVIYVMNHRKYDQFVDLATSTSQEYGDSIEEVDDEGYPVDVKAGNGAYLKRDEPLNRNTVREWSGEWITDEQIRAIEDALIESDIEPHQYFRVRNFSTPDQESDYIWARVNYLHSQIRPGMEPHSLSEDQVKDIIYGMIKAVQYPSAGKGARVSNDDFEEAKTFLMDKTIFSYSLGQLEPTEHKIKGIYITPEHYNQRHLFFSFYGNEWPHQFNDYDKLSENQLGDLLAGEEVELKDSQGEPYIVALGDMAGKGKKVGDIKESDLKAGSKFKTRNGIVWIIDSLERHPDYGTLARTSMEGGEKNRYLDPAYDVALFLTEEGAVEIAAQGKRVDDKFELGTPAIHHRINYNGDEEAEAGEIVMNDIAMWHPKDGPNKELYVAGTLKGMSLYKNKNYSGSEKRFIVPDWNNVETFYEANERNGKKFEIKNTAAKGKKISGLGVGDLLSTDMGYGKIEKDNGDSFDVRTWDENRKIFYLKTMPKNQSGVYFVTVKGDKGYDSTGQGMSISSLFKPEKISNYETRDITEAAIREGREYTDPNSMFAGLKKSNTAKHGTKIENMENYYYLKIGNKIIETFAGTGNQYVYEIVGHDKNGLQVKEHTITKGKKSDTFVINFYDLTKYMGIDAKGYQIEGKPLENERDEFLLQMEIDNIKKSFEVKEKAHEVAEVKQEVSQAKKEADELLNQVTKTKAGVKDTIDAMEALNLKSPYDKKLHAFLDRFPNDAKSWGQATDEIREMAADVRAAYNEQVLDVLEGEPGYVEGLNFREFGKPYQWNTEAKKFILKYWALLPENVKKHTFFADGRWFGKQEEAGKGKMVGGDDYRTRFKGFIEGLEKLSNKTGIAIEGAGSVYNHERTGGQQTFYSNDWTSGDILPSGGKNKESKDAPKNYYKFIKGLEDLTKKYGVEVNIVGGVQTGMYDVEYDKDPTSGDIQYKGRFTTAAKGAKVESETERVKSLGKTGFKQQAKEKKKGKKQPKRGTTTLSERKYIRANDKEFKALKDAYPDSSFKELIAKHKKAGDKKSDSAQYDSKGALKLTEAENDAWENAFNDGLDNGFSDSKADKEAAKAIIAEFPRLKELLKGNTKISTEIAD